MIIYNRTVSFGKLAEVASSRSSALSRLGRMQDGDRIVIAAIHTPSSNVFACFTHLTVLSWDGRLAYMGTSQQVSFVT